MALVRIDRNPSRRQLAVFGATWLAVFAAAGVLAWRREAAVAAWALWAAAVLVPAGGSVAPRLLRLIYVAMAYAAWPIGAAVSVLLLAAVYYLILTPIGLVMRLFGRDPMKRKFPSPEESCWAARPAETPAARYFQQF